MKKLLITIVFVLASLLYAAPEMDLVVTKSFGQAIGYREWNQVVEGIKYGTRAIHTGGLNIPNGTVTANNFAGTINATISTANYSKTSTTANVALNGLLLTGKSEAQLSVATSSYAANSALLGGKSEGTLSVSSSNYAITAATAAYASNSDLLGNKMESELQVATANKALTSNYSANAGLLGGKTEATLSVSTANVAPWAGITGKPTTIAGYGITDAIVTSNYSGAVTIGGALTATASTANNVTWTGIGSKPTTLAGYGITDLIITNNYSGSVTLSGTVKATVSSSNYASTANKLVSNAISQFTNDSNFITSVSTVTTASYAVTANYANNSGQLNGQSASFYMPASTVLFATSNGDARYVSLNMTNYVTQNYNNSVTINGGTGTTPLSVVASVNNFVQILLQNKLTSSNASTDFVAQNDISNGNNFYINMGINSSTYNQAAYDSQGANDGYLYTSDSNLILGAASTNKTVKITAGGTTSRNVVMTISSGNVAITGTLTATASTANYIATANNADLLDGQHGAYYQPASTAVTTNFTGNPVVNGTVSASAYQANGNITFKNGNTINDGSGTGAANIAFGLNAFAENVAGNANTAIGREAIQHSKNGNYNTAVGYRAGLQTAGGVANGITMDYCTYIGANLYPATNNVQYETVIGYGAIGLGSYSTVIGNATYTNKTRTYGTLEPICGSVGGQSISTDGQINGVYIGQGKGSNTGGSLAIGPNAPLGLNTTAYYNTGIGAGALHDNTTQINNTATGYAALYKNVAGQENSAFGSNALNAHITGNYCSAFGAASLIYHANGVNETAIGNGALDYDVTGNYNAALGYKAGSYQQSPQNNVFLGNYAGGVYHGVVVQGVQNGIYIGSGSDWLNDGETNAIVIGYGKKSEGSNSTVIGNSSTLTTHLYGAITSNLLFASKGTGTFGDKAMSRIHMRSTDLSNGLAQIGFGYSESALPAAAIAYKEVSNGGATYGDLMLGVKKDSGTTTTADPVITIQGGQGGGQVNIVATVNITGAYSASNQPYARVEAANRIYLASNGVGRVVTWDNTVLLTGGMTHVSGSITVPVAGYYLIDCNIYTAAGFTAATYQTLGLYVNGTRTGLSMVRFPSTSASTGITFTRVVKLNANDVVKMMMLTDSPDVPVESGDVSFFEVTKLF